MAVNYQKPYTYLVAKVDDTLKIMDTVAVKGNSVETVASLVREGLVKALQGAEEMYLSQEE